MCNQASGDMPDNDLRLRSFSSGNGLLVGRSVFQHKDIHKKTWRSPDAATTYQIDHFCISKKWASSLQDDRAYREADVGSDHMLLVEQGKFKLKWIVNKQRLVHPDRNNLKDSKLRKQLQLELSNRFRILQDMDEELEQMWTSWKDKTNDAALKPLGPKRGSWKERWISNET